MITWNSRRRSTFRGLSLSLKEGFYGGDGPSWPAPIRAYEDGDPDQQQHQGDLPGISPTRPAHPIRSRQLPTAPGWWAALRRERAALLISGCRYSTLSNGPTHKRVAMPVSSFCRPAGAGGKARSSRRYRRRSDSSFASPREFPSSTWSRPSAPCRDQSRNR